MREVELPAIEDDLLTEGVAAKLKELDQQLQQGKFLVHLKGH